MGGGSSSFQYTSASELKDQIQKAQDEQKKANYQSDVNNFLDECLIGVNRRDVEAVKKHMDEIKKAINKEIDGTITSTFGGSVAKHTYVDGLSDIDSLVILNASELKGKSPDEVKNYFYKLLTDRFPRTKIEKGKLAVSLNFSDVQVQLLPALKYKYGVKITDSSGQRWSNMIRPNVFSRMLTVQNRKLKNRLIPAIKLIKSINSQLPSNIKLSGYHTESLAIEAFKNYGGKCTTKEMLTHFYKSAKDKVKSPIRDSSKQSLHVDDYLGTKNSNLRLRISDHFARIQRRMELADTNLSRSIWEELIK